MVCRSAFIPDSPPGGGQGRRVGRTRRRDTAPARHRSRPAAPGTARTSVAGPHGAPSPGRPRAAPADAWTPRAGSARAGRRARRPGARRRAAGRAAGDGGDRRGPRRQWLMTSEYAIASYITVKACMTWRRRPGVTGGRGPPYHQGEGAAERATRRAGFPAERRMLEARQPRHCRHCWGDCGGYCLLDDGTCIHGWNGNRPRHQRAGAADPPVVGPGALGRVREALREASHDMSVSESAWTVEWFGTDHLPGPPTGPRPVLRRLPRPAARPGPGRPERRGGRAGRLRVRQPRPLRPSLRRGPHRPRDRRHRRRLPGERPHPAPGRRPGRAAPHGHRGRDRALRPGRLRPGAAGPALLPVRGERAPTRRLPASETSGSAPRTGGASVRSALSAASLRRRRPSPTP